MRAFLKPAIDVAAQVELLKRRGLTINDEQNAQHFLEVVSFFRLTPYMRPFQRPNDMEHGFLPGTTLGSLTSLYDFDRRLRLLVMDAIERIEVAVRASISNHLGQAYGAHWHLKRELFHDSYRHDELLEILRGKQARAWQDHQRECRRIDALSTPDARKQSLKRLRAKESYARHYALTYEMPDLMPGWAVMEEITLGTLSHLFKGLARDTDRKAIARRLDLPGPLLQSWLHTLTTIRNMCAHHARLWNRELGIRPELPKNAACPWPEHPQQSGQHVRMFTVLSMLSVLMRKISPDGQWDKRLGGLLMAFPEINQRAMGFANDWLQDPFWRGCG